LQQQEYEKLKKKGSSIKAISSTSNINDMSICSRPFISL